MLFLLELSALLLMILPCLKMLDGFDVLVVSVDVAHLVGAPVVARHNISEAPSLNEL